MVLLLHTAFIRRFLSGGVRTGIALRDGKNSIFGSLQARRGRVNISGVRAEAKIAVNA